MLSLSMENVLSEENTDRLTSKLRLLINWGKLYKLDDGSFASLIGKTKDGKASIVKYERQDKEKGQLKLTGKIEEIRGETAKTDLIEDSSITNRVKGLLLSRRGITDNKVRTLIIKDDFKTYLDNADKNIVIVYAGNKIYKLSSHFCIFDKEQ
jgi:hypothetical protein